MEIKTYINKLIDKKDGSIDAYISKILDHLSIKDKEKAECELYELSEGKVLNEEKATHLIEAMKPAGMKWKLEKTEAVRNNYNYTDIRPIDFWIVMNSAYNDYNDIFAENVEYYAKFSKDFIKDEDAVEDKVYYYFTMIPKKD